MVRRTVLAALLLILGARVPVAAQVVDPPATFERNPVLSDIHQGLGWATLASAAATGVLNPGRANLQTHETLAWTTAGLAAATMVLGIAAHWGEIGPDQGSGSDNIHAILGAAGGTMMIVTPFLAPGRIHQTLGEAGALTMGLAMTWKFVF